MKNRNRWLALAVVLLLVLLAWLFWPDRRLARAKAMQNELFSEAAKSLTPEQRREKWQQYQRLTKQMTPTQREALSAESNKRRQVELGRYFAMSPAEKTRHLDEQIRRMEQFNKQRQAAQPNRAGQSTQRQGDRPVAARDQGRQRRLDSSSPAERAARSQYAKDLDARRAQLGMRPMGPGFGPPR